MEHSYIVEFRGSEAVESFYCKFIYWFVESRNKGFVLDLKTSLYYSELLLGKVSPQIFYCETSLFHWFSWVIISCLIYYSVVHDFDLLLMFVCLNKVH